MAASSTSTFSALRLLSNLFPGLGRPPTSWEKGAAGEEAVARRLEKLPPHEWIALHDLPLGSGGRNVDHLVIGARGIFSLNTKNLSGNVVVKRNAFLVGGFGDRCLHVARDEASKVGERLTLAVGEPVHVNPVIVVLAPALVVDSQPDDVHVAGIDEIVRWLTSRPEVLGARMASRTYEAARRRRTWTEDLAALRTGASGPRTSVWRRYGHDRVYVNASDGTTLGHLDRKTGEIFVRDVALTGEVRAALAPFLETR